MSIVERIHLRLPVEHDQPEDDGVGVALFSGIGLLLSLVAMLFGWLGAPGPMMF